MLRRTLSTIFKCTRPTIVSKTRQTCCLTPVLLSIAACESKKEIYVVEESALDHDFLIKQATTVNVNAATQLLTVTMAAIQETSEKLRTNLVQEINIYKQAQEIGLGAIAPNHWDRLVEVRNTITDLKHNLITLFSYMEYAEKLATTAAEISFLSGNTAASDAICQRINHANSVCAAQKEENALLQRECLQLHKEVIDTSPQLEQIIHREDIPHITGEKLKS